MSDSPFNRQKSKLGQGAPRSRAPARPEYSDRDREDRRPPRSPAPDSGWPGRTEAPAESSFAGRSSYDKLKEVKLYGEKSCQATFAARPQDIVRLYLSEAMAPRFGKVMKYLAANKRAYHVLDEQELQKIGGTQHHGGVVMLVRRKPWLNLAQWLAAGGSKGAVLALDDLANPHNLGAIMRTAAHFGVNTILTTSPELLQSGAAVRTAEGGFESLEIVRVANLPEALLDMQQQGYSVAMTSSHQGQPLYQEPLPQRLVLVLGEEKDGIAPELLAKGAFTLSIPGVGAVESLNVSVAAALLLGEWYRQWH